MICFRPALTITSFTFFVLATSPLMAQDRLKVAIGQMDAWVNQAPVLGQQTGIFRKYDIELENFATQGSGETLQAVVSNAAQVGIGVGTLGALRAYSRGAPIKIFGASFTGVGDLYWYVRADSAINTLIDAGLAISPVGHARRSCKRIVIGDQLRAFSRSREIAARGLVEAVFPLPAPGGPSNINLIYAAPAASIV
jgi:ABC-type nitrate/sulfonate/bicarbonate transport system substrate-binding protein